MADLSFKPSNFYQKKDIKNGTYWNVFNSYVFMH